MSSEPAGSDSLLSQFRNVGEAFADRVVVKPTGEVFHRLAHDDDLNADHLRPACGFCPDDADWQLATPEAVHQAGLSPCRKCYKGIFEYLAREPTSPVEARTATPDLDARTAGDGTEFELVRPTPLPSPLTALTEDVMVTGGASKVMHAPTSEGPLCDETGDYRRVERTVVAGHYRPCRDCFLVSED